MSITGGDIVFITIVIMYFAHEIFRIWCIREIARLAADAEKGKETEE